MTKIFVGWDGGGTGTTVACIDHHGRLLARERFGPLNLTGAAEETVEKTVADCVRFMRGFGSCGGLCIGTAGISHSQTADTLKRLLIQQGVTQPPVLAGDHETALSGAIGGPGIVLIAGTGSIAYGKNTQGLAARCGGYGHLIDDEGSGYAIGRDILIAVLRAADGRGPETALTNAVSERLGSCSPMDLVAYTYHSSHSKAHIAALAPLLAPAAQAGDTVAIGIAEHAAEELLLLAQALTIQLSMPDAEIALLGSVLVHLEAISSRTKALLRDQLPQLRLVAPREDAAYGAALLSLNQHQGGFPNA